MTFKDEIFCIVSKLYDLNRENPKLSFHCSIETQNNFYCGTLEIDKNHVINPECIILNTVLLSDKMKDNAIIKLNKSCISFEAIKVFSYTEHEN